MSFIGIEKIFKPASIALVGASLKEGSVGRALMSNLVDGGFMGQIYPVNPNYEELMGRKAFKDLESVGQEIDLAIIATPIASVPGLMGQCADLKVPGALIVSAGGSERGREGRDLEAAIKREAQRGPTRFIGPNCLGIICPHERLNASFASQRASKGSIAFISQSGALCSAILGHALKYNIGFSHFISIGNMADVNFGDIIDYLGADSRVKSILLYLESLKDYKEFMSAARAVSRKKPIIALKAGIRGEGAKAAASHTGALASEDAVYDAAFKRAGIIRVREVSHLFDCAECLADQPRVRGNRLAVITNAGGPGVMAVDALSRWGHKPAELSKDTVEKLDSVLPEYWSRSNPVDILGDADPERFRLAIEICLKAPELDGIMVVLTHQFMTDPEGVASALAQARRKSRSRPLFAVWMGGLDIWASRNILSEAGIPTFEAPERAVDSFMYIYSYSYNLELLQQTPPKISSPLEADTAGSKAIIEAALGEERGLLTELESKDLLDAYGIPVNPTEAAFSGPDAVGLARKMGFPVALKVHSQEITHKSDIGGVALNIGTEEEVVSEYERIVARAREHLGSEGAVGVTVQPMIEAPDYELILGSKTDPGFGPVILFGAGGVAAEVFQDRAIDLPPLNRLLAKRLMESTRVSRLLKGFRGSPKADLELLERILIMLSRLVVDFPEIVELDINPLLVKDGFARVADARVVLAPAKRPAPFHLAIAPYPNHYETYWEMEDGTRLLLRPIRPEDEPMMQELFDNFSQETKYYRFFQAFHAMDHEKMVRFTQIDYAREMAFVAVESTPEGERILGESRLIVNLDRKSAEFAIAVGDPWQGRGLGRRLMEVLLEIVHDYGLKKIAGYVMPENTRMLALCRELGFNVRLNRESMVYELDMEFI